MSAALFELEQMFDEGMEKMTKLNKIENEINELKTKMNDPHLCEGTADTYSRISGYYRSVEGGWNSGKQQEFRERQEYNI